jgi:hypothetical protein
MEHCRAFSQFLPQVRTELSQVDIVNQDPSSGEVVSTSELPWSNRVVIYTDNAAASNSDIRAIFGSTGFEVVLIDDESWKQTLELKALHISSAHDLGGNINPSRSLADPTSRMDRPLSYPVSDTSSIADFKIYFPFRLDHAHDIVDLGKILEDRTTLMAVFNEAYFPAILMRLVHFRSGARAAEPVQCDCRADRGQGVGHPVRRPSGGEIEPDHVVFAHDLTSSFMRTTLAVLPAILPEIAIWSWTSCSTSNQWNPTRESAKSWRGRLKEN